MPRTPPRSLPLSAYVPDATLPGGGLGGAAAPLPPHLAAAQEELRQDFLRTIAFADERTRLNAALTGGQTLRCKSRAGTVYRLHRVLDDGVCLWQDPDYDLPHDWREPGKDYTGHLSRRDLVTRVDPQGKVWATWLRHLGLRRHWLYDPE